MVKFIKLLCLILSFSTYFFLANDFKKAIKKGSYVKVKNIIKKGIDVNCYLGMDDNNSISPIELALRSKNEEIVKLLLFFNANPDNKSCEWCNNDASDWDYPAGNPWASSYSYYYIHDYASSDLKVLLEATILLNENKFVDALQKLTNNNLLEKYGTFILLLSYKKKALAKITQNNFKLNLEKYKKELDILEGNIADTKDELKLLITNYMHKEIIFKDKVKSMSYIAAVLSGPRYHYNEDTGKKTAALGLPQEIATKIASYVEDIILEFI